MGKFVPNNAGIREMMKDGDLQATLRAYAERANAIYGGGALIEPYVGVTRANVALAPKKGDFTNALQKAVRSTKT